jgi:hypothetical protein
MAAMRKTIVWQGENAFSTMSLTKFLWSGIQPAKRIQPQVQPNALAQWRRTACVEIENNNNIHIHGKIQIRIPLAGRV